MTTTVTMKEHKRQKHARIYDPSIRMAALCTLLLLVLLVVQPENVHGRELELTKEWQVVGANDTVPAGAHIRMDMTTGEKMAKLVDDNDDNDGDGNNDGTNSRAGSGMDAVAIDADGGVRAVSTAAVAVDPVSSSGTNSENGNDTGSDGDDGESPNSDPDYDYDMMHRTLSHLPPDEQQRMGGLPELPGSSGKIVSTEERAVFEERMKEIWEQRQTELAAIQDDLLADLPAVLKDRIGWIRGYLENPFDELVKLTTVSESSRNSDDDNNDGDNDDGQMSIVGDINAALLDLEYQLTDVDMARDFHTLGGWPLLVSLLHHSAHAVNGTKTDAMERAVQTIQTNAAWVIGTIVKNTGEFYPFATEPIQVAEMGGALETNAVELLLHQYRAGDATETPWSRQLQQKRQKVLYGLGSLLRGNRAAQRSFLVMQGPTILVGQLQERCQSQPKIAKKVLALVSDLVSDSLTIHEQDPSIGEAVLEAFSDAVVCQEIVTCLQNGDGSLMETALRTLASVATHCRDNHEGEAFVEPTVRALQEAKDWWRMSGKDPEVIRELVDLATETQQLLKTE